MCYKRNYFYNNFNICMHFLDMPLYIYECSGYLQNKNWNLPRPCALSIELFDK